MGKKNIRVTLQIDLDESFLCDDKTLRDEFDNSVENYVKWFAENCGTGELISFGDAELIVKNAEEIEINNG